MLSFAWKSFPKKFDFQVENSIKLDFSRDLSSFSWLNEWCIGFSENLIASSDRTLKNVPKTCFIYPITSIFHWVNGDYVPDWGKYRTRSIVYIMDTYSNRSSICWNETACLPNGRRGLGPHHNKKNPHTALASCTCYSNNVVWNVCKPLLIIMFNTLDNEIKIFLSCFCS